MRSFEVRIPIKKIDLKRGLVTGWASIVTDKRGIPIIDSDDEIIPVEELEQATQEAFLKFGGAGKVGDMHEFQGRADLVESFVMTAEKREALGFGVGPEGWIVTVKINDPELMKSVANAEKLEFSIKGSATSEQVAA